MNILESVNNLIENTDDQNLIYHYSLKKFPVLLTVNKQHDLKIISDQNYKRSVDHQNKDPQTPSYLDHISFLIDPLPIDLIKSGFKDSNNDLYKSFNCYEYKININTLKNNLNWFRIAESPIDVFFYNHLWVEIDFPGRDFLYFGGKELFNKLTGNQGDDFDKFKTAIKKYKGGTRKAFEDLTKNKDFDDYKKRGMYAPTVPHIMIYPSNGEIEYQSVKKIDL